MIAPFYHRMLCHLFRQKKILLPDLLFNWDTFGRLQFSGLALRNYQVIVIISKELTSESLFFDFRNIYAISIILPYCRTRSTDAIYLKCSAYNLFDSYAIIFTTFIYILILLP